MSNQPRRILWHSVKPTIPSGYGQQSAIMLEMLQENGYAVDISCSFGQQGHTDDWRGMRCLPCGKSANLMGNDVIANHFRYTKADLVLSFVDMFVLDPGVWGKLPWGGWCMVDSAPLGAPLRKMLHAVKWIFAESKFGQNVLADAGFKSHYVPHVLDDDVFYPGDQQQARKAIKEQLGHDLTGAFLVCVTSANCGHNGRKNFYSTLKAVAEMQRKHADVVLYLHTDVTGMMQGGSDLNAMITHFGCDPERIIFPPQWHLTTGMIDAAWLANFYRASDVYLNASMGEGFGLPILEAQGCGCPVLVTDFAAGPEIVYGGETMDGVMIPSFDETAWKFVEWQTVVSGLEHFHAMNAIELASLREKASSGAHMLNKRDSFSRFLAPVLDEIFDELGKV